MSREVPRLARVFLERVLPPDRRADVIGDLTEVHARRRARLRSLATPVTCADALLVAAAFLLHGTGGPLGAGSPLRLAADVCTDVRFAVRHFARRPASTLLVLGTLALGVGSTFALFVVAQGLLLRPLPYAHEDRTVVLSRPGPWRAGELDVARRMSLPSLEATGGYTTTGGTLKTGGGNMVVRTALLFPGTLQLLGPVPAVGRTFQESDHVPGAPESVVVSATLWRSALAGDSTAVGRSIEVDGRLMTVIGVMPEGFFFPDPDVRLWRPLVMDPTSAAYAGRSWLTAIALVREGASPGGVQQDLDRLWTELNARFEYPSGSAAARTPTTVKLRRHLLGDVRSVLLLLLGGVLLLLAAACANVMVLVSARTYERRGELALRRSLGAPAARVVRQLVSEGALLGTLAGILAVALGAFLCRTLAHFLPLGPGFEQLPRLEGSVAVAAVAVSAVLGALAATLPAAVIWRGASGFAGAIREAATDGRVHRLQSALVVAQVAAALTLVSGATLMTRSVAKLLNVELGLRSEDVWVANVSLATRTQAERRASYADISERIERLPGVERVGLISHLPLRDLGWAGPVRAADQPEVRDTDARLAYFRVVSPGALEALGIPVLSGRDFTAQDGESSEPVVLVNRAFADALWPGQDPIGRRIASIGFEGELWATVVGVVGEVRFDGPARDVGSVFYRPLAQVGAPTEVALVVWGSAASDALGVRLRSEIGAADPAAAVHSISTMEGVLRASIGSALRLRFFMSLLSGLALAVGSAGVFGMVSYAVSRRTREYGIRMVLGADGAQLVRSEVRRAAFTVALGGAIGVAASLPSARALDAFLFGVGPADPASFAGALALLLLVGLGAAVVPAARAGRVDPLSSLKAD